jgi:hypothetical protein
MLMIVLEIHFAAKKFTGEIKRHRKRRPGSTSFSQNKLLGFRIIFHEGLRRTTCLNEAVSTEAQDCSMVCSVAPQMLVKN